MAIVRRIVNLLRRRSPFDARSGPAPQDLPQQQLTDEPPVDFIDAARRAFGERERREDYRQNGRPTW